MILRPLFCFKDTKNTGLLIFNSLKQKKLIFNFVVNRNWKKITDSRKRAKILADNRKSYHPIETLLSRTLWFTDITSHKRKKIASFLMAANTVWSLLEVKGLSYDENLFCVFFFDQ